MTRTMRAAVCAAYGPPEVVRIEEIPVPEPGGNELLVRNRAATVGAADSAARSGTPHFARLAFGLRRPRNTVLGSDFSGEVVAVGPGVTRFQVGDEVFGHTGATFGGHAEYVRIAQDGAVAAKPEGLSHAEAVAVADATALVFLRDKARLRPGQTALVNGAGGSVGSVAVQLARHFGAHVTAVCGTANVAFVRDLGADAVIDYTGEDFTRGDARYDVVFDAAGKSSFARSRRVLERDGVYLTTVPSLAILVDMPWTAVVGRRRAVVSFTGLRPAAEKAKDLLVTTGLVERGRLAPVLGGTFPLDRITEAYAIADTGHKRGTLVVTMDDVTR